MYSNETTICQICNKVIKLNERAVPYHKGTINDRQQFRHMSCEPNIIPPAYRRKWNIDSRTQIIPNKKRRTRAQQRDDLRKERDTD